MVELKYKEIVFEKINKEYNKTIYVGDVASHVTCNKDKADFIHIGNINFVLNYDNYVDEIEGLEYNFGQEYQLTKYMMAKILPIVKMVESEYNLFELSLSENIIKRVYDTDSFHYAIIWSVKDKSISLLFKYFREVKWKN